MAEIKVEVNNNFEFEKEDGEIEDEFDTDPVPPPEEQEISIEKEIRIEKCKVEGVCSPLSVEEVEDVPEMEMIVFTPPSPVRDDDLSSVSDQSEDEEEPEEITEADEEIDSGIKDELICRLSNCHCIELKKDNQRLRNVVSELCRRNGEMDDFLQVEFGEKYKLFRNNRKYLIQIGFGEECDPERESDEKGENPDIVKLLRMVKEHEDKHGVHPSTSGEDRVPAQAQSARALELELSLERRLSSIPERGSKSDIKEKPRRSPPLKARTPIKSKAEVGNKSNIKKKLIESSSSKGKTLIKSKAKTGISSKSDTEKTRPKETSLQKHKPSSSKSKVESKSEPVKLVVKLPLVKETSRTRKRSSPFQVISDPVEIPKRSRSRTESDSNNPSKRVRLAPSQSSPTKTTTATKTPLDPLGLEVCSATGNVEPKFKLCPLCPLMVPSEELMDHLLIIHKGIQNICPGCNLEFISRRTLRIHFSETHGNRGTGYAKFQASISIEPEVKKWLSEKVDMAIAVNQHDFDSFAEIPANPAPQDGWCIYVYNLGSEKDETHLVDLFAQFGSIERASIVRDPQTNKSKGFGFVTMTNYDEAVLAIHSRHDYELDNSRVLHVSFAKATKYKLLKCKS